MLHKTGDRSYLNAFGKLRFQNELHELRRKLDSKWQEKLNDIEEVILNPDRVQTSSSNREIIKVCTICCQNVIVLKQE